MYTTHKQTDRQLLYYSVRSHASMPLKKAKKACDQRELRIFLVYKIWWGGLGMAELVRLVVPTYLLSCPTYLPYLPRYLPSLPI